MTLFYLTRWLAHLMGHENVEDQVFMAYSWPMKTALVRLALFMGHENFAEGVPWAMNFRYPWIQGILMANEKWLKQNGLFSWAMKC